MRKCLSPSVAASTAAVFVGVAACAVGQGDRSGSGGAPAGGGQSASGASSASGGSLTSGGSGSGPALPQLQSAPLIFSPTLDSFGVNVVMGPGETTELGLQYRAVGDDVWQAAGEPEHPADDIAQWTITALQAGTRYEYRLFAPSLADGAAGADAISVATRLYEGTAVTQRPAGESFTFALITDTHISPRDFPPRSLAAGEYQEQVLLEIAPQVQALAPDFIVNLGDMLDFHDFGFNLPPPSGTYTRLAYLNYRRCLRDALGNSAHFPVIGNWDGENGNYSASEIAYSQTERFRYLPGPTPDTYPEGGSPTQDYYAYTWGDALFVVLNVMTYTEKELLLDGAYGSPEDWTLGAPQLAWLEQTLRAAQSRWKFLLIHHAVGGAGGDLSNAIYGRGGGLAANVGEQARVHDLMLQHGVQVFFYGHDHVFTDMVVDDVHYSLPGSAGAPWKFSTAETGYATQWDDSGYASVLVTPTDVNVKFLSISGDTLLDYTLR